jgi:hypothetical protein
MNSLHIVAVVMLAASVVAAQPPVVGYPVTYPVDYNGRFLAERDVDDIVRFIRTIPQVDHRVRLISVSSADDIQVHTGPRLGNPGGDTLHLRKSHWTWTLVSKSKGSGF